MLGTGSASAPLLPAPILYLNLSVSRYLAACFRSSSLKANLNSAAGSIPHHPAADRARGENIDGGIVGKRRDQRVGQAPPEGASRVRQFFEGGLLK